MLILKDNDIFKDQKSMKEKKNTDSYDYLAHAASTMDCTGLMPTPATSDAERESYEAIYHFEPPKIKKEQS